jgi:ATP/maltotriose-dependent transcriptional regulator MalT
MKPTLAATKSVSYAFRSRKRNTPFGQCSSGRDAASVACMTQVLSERAPKLTERQREVVELIAAGMSNDEVGERLGISPRTAKAHSDVLRQKLGVSRRRQIPVAYRLLTGEDPLAKSLGSGAS